MPILMPPDGAKRAAPTLLLITVLSLLLGALAGPALAQEDAAESLFGFLRERTDDATNNVADAVVTVLDEGGAVVGEATSDETGRWEVPLPGPGTYTANLDLTTLPEGIGTTGREGSTITVDGDVASLTVEVQANRNAPANFPLGEGRTIGDSLLRQILQRTLSGLQFGLLIAMGAIGLSLIFGTTGLVNFAHGEMVTWGAIVAFWANTALGLNIIWAAVIAMIIGGVAGLAIDRGVFNPLRSGGASLVAQLVITIGLSFLFRNFFQYLFGAAPRAMNYSTPQNLQFGVLGETIEINPLGLGVIGVSLVVLTAVGLGLQFTRIGKAMRAVADNRDLAESSGIDVDRVISLVWLFGGALAALAGTLLALDEIAKFDLGFRLLLLIFAGVTLGGLGTSFGALVGSVIVGIFVNVSTVTVPTNLKNVGALLVLIVILMVRPQGIFGQRERIG